MAGIRKLFSIKGEVAWILLVLQGCHSVQLCQCCMKNLCIIDNPIRLACSENYMPHDYNFPTSVLDCKILRYIKYCQYKNNRSIKALREN